MILKLDIEVKRLSIEQANECDKDTLCFDFGRIIGVSGGGGDNLWEIGEGDILLPKEDRTFTIKKAYEVDVADGNPDLFLNQVGDMAQVEAGQVKYTPSDFVESENVQDAITELGDKIGTINEILDFINGEVI
jgi:hypothetical protein